MAKHNQGKIVIDIEKHYKKNRILIDINAAKLQGPIVLIDPTYKQRNILAALSQETFNKFQESCRKFLKNPDTKSFEPKKIDPEKIKKTAKKRGYDFIFLKAETNRQEGDIAGSKLLKFYNHLASEIEKYFEIKSKGFEYSGKKEAVYFFVVDKGKELLIQGPMLKQEFHVKRFRKKHKKVFAKNNRLYFKYKTNKNLRQFLEDWKKNNVRKIEEMGLIGLKLV